MKYIIWILTWIVVYVMLILTIITCAYSMLKGKFIIAIFLGVISFIELKYLQERD